MDDRLALEEVLCHLVANCHLPIAISNGNWLRNVGNLACQLKWRNGYHRQFIERE